MPHKGHFLYKSRHFAYWRTSSVERPLLAAFAAFHALALEGADAVDLAGGPGVGEVELFRASLAFGPEQLR
jgi:hypothetical protein